jgi:hypothetical protein
LPRLKAKIRLLLHLSRNPNLNAQRAKMVVKMMFHPWHKFPPNARLENLAIDVIHLSLKSAIELT